ncbi:hypothetical protein [Methylomonas albis]|nr:hypothetical protein [Methylomonas albis]
MISVSPQRKAVTATSFPDFLSKNHTFYLLGRHLRFGLPVTVAEKFTRMRLQFNRIAEKGANSV